MKLGIRSRLFLVSMVLLVTVGLPAGVYLEGRLRESLERRIQDEIERHARSARDAIELATTSRAIAEIDAVADRMGLATETRITVIDPSGVVLGDSRVAVSDINEIENHADRPEIREAIRAGQGIATRHSATLGTDMLYVAVALGGGGGVVRAAMPLSEIDERTAQLRVLLAFAALVALGAAALMSMLASRYLARTLSAVVGTTQLAAIGGAAGLVDDDSGSATGPVARLTRELKQSVEALALERDRFKTALEGMPDALLALDADARVTAMNGVSQDLLGLEAGAEGRPLDELVALPELLDLVNNARGGEIDLETTTGDVRRVLVSMTPQVASGGCVIVLRDVTEIRRLETVRRDFVANVSHELRTPVSVIRANAETLAGAAKDDPQQRERFLQAMLRNADRLGRLISDLLDISKIDVGKYPLHVDTVSVAETAERVVEAVEPEARTKDIRVVIDVPTGLDIVADAKAIEQVLTNLVDNAVKYTQPGGNVEVFAIAGADDVRIEVRDNGPGIDAVHRERVFERFYRADPGRSRDMGGTGLGLAIVKNLVDAMGGRVGVEPRRPQGSVFWLALPRSD